MNDQPAPETAPEGAPAEGAPFDTQAAVQELQALVARLAGQGADPTAILLGAQLDTLVHMLVGGGLLPVDRWNREVLTAQSERLRQTLAQLSLLRPAGPAGGNGLLVARR